MILMRRFLKNKRILIGNFNPCACAVLCWHYLSHNEIKNMNEKRFPIIFFFGGGFFFPLPSPFDPTGWVFLGLDVFSFFLLLLQYSQNPLRWTHPMIQVAMLGKLSQAKFFRFCFQIGFLMELGRRV